MQLLRWLVLLAAFFALNACVPVVVVGAAGGGKIYVDRQEDKQLEQADGVVLSALAVDNKSAGSNLESIPVEAVKAELKVEPKVSVSPLQESPGQGKGADEPLSSQQPLQTPSEGDVLAKLINRGWKVSLDGGQNVDGSVLYFDLDQNFYGFDGRRYFRGKYQTGMSGSFMINSLIVSSKGSNACGNQVTKNLFFVDSFKVEQDVVTLHAKNTLAMTLTAQTPFDLKAFLNKAKFKNRKTRTR